MDWRNRIGLYGGDFLGMAGIGFTLRYLPLYLGRHEEVTSDLGIEPVAAVSDLSTTP